MDGAKAHLLMPPHPWNTLPPVPTLLLDCFKFNMFPLLGVGVHKQPFTLTTGTPSCAPAIAKAFRILLTTSKPKGIWSRCAYTHTTIKLILDHDNGWFTINWRCTPNYPPPPKAKIHRILSKGGGDQKLSTPMHPPPD